MLLVMCSGGAWADGKKRPVEITADGENRYVDGIAYAEGNVVVRHGSDVIYADEVIFDREKRMVTARGNVSVFVDKRIYRGNILQYNLDNSEVKSEDFRSVQDGLLLFGESIQSPRPGKYVIRHGGLTFENRDQPSYKIKASTIEVYPDDRVVFKNVGVYIGDVPVMWLPYVAQTLGQEQDNFDISAGSTSRWGGYVLSSYRWSPEKNWTTSLNFDYRSKRGFAGGGDLLYKTEAGNEAYFTGWGTTDWGNDIQTGSTTRRLVEPPRDRYRFEYHHKFNLGENLYTKADLNLWSDRFVTEDFFTDEFRQETQPDNYLDLTYYNENFTAGILARAQIGNIFNVVERKPEVRIDFKRQDLFGLPVDYVGESSVTKFELQFDPDISGRLPSLDATRYDTFHQIQYPRQYFGFLNLMPRVGFRATQYTQNNVEPNTPTDEIGRVLFNTGLSASFKVSSTWRDIQNPDFGIDGIRHVAEPYVDVAYIPEPNVLNNEFAGFDRRLPHTRLQPIHFPGYNSVDSITTTTNIRHGIRNKIATKRDGKNVDLVDWKLYGDIDLQRNNVFTADHPYPQIYSELTLNPLPWLKYDMYASVGLVNDSWEELNHELTWQLHPSLDLSVSHRYADGIPFVEDSNQVSLGTFWRLNEDWQFSQRFTFEGDTGNFQEQKYTVFKDLRAWKLSVTGVHRDNEGTSDEFLAYFSLTLKAFPEFSLSVNN